MVVVNRIGGRFPGSHLRDFILREVIILEIGETPIRVTETWSNGDCPSIRLDGLLPPSNGPKGVPECYVKTRGFRRGGEQLAIQLYSPFVSSETDARGCRQ